MRASNDTIENKARCDEAGVLCLSGPFLPEQNLTTPQLIDRQADLTPNSIALCLANSQLSYFELKERANQLAHFLQSRGLGVGKFVGICLDRSFEMAIGLLGIMKSGATYVPLDPSFPSERLEFMIADAEMQCILSTTEIVKTIPALNPDRTEILKLDRLSDRLAEFPTHSPGVESLTQSPAYLIYTSGTTGKPKGVLVSHEALVNFLRSMQISPGITAEDRLLALTTISFDISALELYLPLITGASVRLLTRSEARNSDILNQLTESGEITIVQATPTTWKMMLNAGWKGHPKLKALVGGEAFPPAMAKQMLDKCQEIWNMFGPTETTIWSTIAPVTDLQISIGTPIHNTRVYLLENSEICIGGKGLALGYKDRLSLTAEKFVYSEIAGERIYRTGDLGRIDEAGKLYCLGRIDHQVKVNGFRIETGEIESHIDEDDGVQESLVTAKSYGTNDSRLVAYVIPKLPKTDRTDRGSAKVAQWQQIWTHAHRQEPVIYDPVFNYTGYNNSFTGKPIPEAQMREWSQNTIERIKQLNPKRVLEIGCGTGILLFAIAPETEAYVGLDISTSALSHIQNQIDRNPNLASRVTLYHRPAHNLPDLEPGTFDTIILNSVVQYFPSADYLKSVIEKLIPLLAPKGSIFIGDVRNLSLLTVFHEKLLATMASQTVDKQQVQQSVRKEEELVIHPEWFLTFQTEISRVSDIRIMPKVGHFENEFTCFRYDTTISMDVRKTEKVQWLDWQAQNWTKTRLEEMIQKQPRVLALQNVDNFWIWALNDNRAIKPSDCCDLGTKYNYVVHTSWANSDENGRFDVVFLKDKNVIPVFPQSDRQLPPRKLTNFPMLLGLEQQLEPRLRQRLREVLPDYMIPKAFVFLDAFPQTLNGKIDRQQLPVPTIGRPNLSNHFEQPKTKEESLLAQLWADVLKINDVGVTDNFFDLGGSSILLTLLLEKIKETFETVNIQIIDLFEYPTIQAQAEYLRSNSSPGRSEGSQKSELPVERSPRRPVQRRRDLRKALRNKLNHNE